MSTIKKRKAEDGDQAHQHKQNNNNGNQPHPESKSSTNRLSCQRCRIRKVKCNFEIPCDNCIKVGVECVQTTADMRKKRPAVDYVNKLQAKVDVFTKFIQQFKTLDSMESKTDLINQTDFDKLVKEVSRPPPQAIGSSSSSPAHMETHHHDEDEDRAIYGPTSVYHDAFPTSNSKLKNNRDSSQTINRMNKDSDILTCIKLFFTWQYPDHNMFIFREAFLNDFVNPKPTSLYCSQKLILSICALGARMSDDDRIYNKSKQYYLDAKTLLLNQLGQPSITSLQSFMLLAFYDICSGLNSSGWMLSGNAMRMGFDLGFQLNPQVWFVESKNKSLSNLDVDIRSRIYWGCYMADHFISLLLGRPAVLKFSDASISETNDLPDSEGIDDFTYEGYVKQQQIGFHAPPQVKGSYISDPLRKIINLINISDNMLNDIFSKSEHEESNTSEDIDLISRWEKLIEYNAQIMKWKMSLPDDLQWNREKLKTTGENPTYSCIRYYYYILLLCLNRPFVGIETDKVPEDHYLSPLSICSNAIDDLYESIKRFQSAHGYRRVSIFIVYSSILSISIILLTNTSKQLVNEKKDRLQFFMGVLYGCSKTWKLAEKSYNLIKIKLKDRYEAGELQDDEQQVSSKTISQPKVSKQKRAKPVRNAVPIKSELQTLHHSPSPQPSNLSTVRSTYTPALNKQSQPSQKFSPETASSTGITGAPNTGAAIATTSTQISPSPISSSGSMNQSSIVESNSNDLFDKNLDFLGGPPVLMTSDLFNEDWEALFPDYIFNSKN
ncbi:hypothetical protein JA1_004697 [Spathaspora sp. JA1]|nr:hypothetical protein JA1_004697 [Spathaspora sp. JA1]